MKGNKKNTSNRFLSLLLIFLILFFISVWQTVFGDQNFQNFKNNSLNYPSSKTNKVKNKSKVKHIPGQFIVKFKSTSSLSTKSITSLNNRLNISSKKPVFNKSGNKRLRDKYGLDNIYVVKTKKPEDAIKAIDLFKKDPNVLYAEPSIEMKSQLQPDDTYFDTSGSWEQNHKDMYGLKNIFAEAAWDITTGSSDISVAVVDTGIDYTHEDINGKIWTNPGETGNGREINGIDDDNNNYIDDWRGVDFAGKDEYAPAYDNDATDTEGHGTHVSGTIAAQTNNGIGIAGVSWKSKIMPIKVFADHTSWLSDSTGALGIRYAADKGAKVINCSWGGYGNSKVVQDAINYAFEKGSVVVVAAGNEGDDCREESPANCENVMAVAAVNNNDNAPNWSNTGYKIAVSAPGVDILSLSAGGTFNLFASISNLRKEYTVLSGTSMASPHVAGLAALIASNKPMWNPSQIMAQIVTTADNVDLGNADKEDKLGSGRINAYKALTQQKPPASAKFMGINVVNLTKTLSGNTVNLATNIKNFGSGLRDIEATLTTTNSTVVVTKNTATYGNIDTFKEANNSSNPFVIEIPSDVSLDKAINFTLKIVGSSDSGNYSVNKKFAYTAGDIITPPRVFNSYPKNNDTNIEPDQTVSITISKRIDRDTVTNNSVYLEASDVPGQHILAGIETVNDIKEDKSTIYITPKINLKNNTTYNINLTSDISDLNGNHLVKYLGNYKIIDYSLPQYSFDQIFDSRDVIKNWPSLNNNGNAAWSAANFIYYYDGKSVKTIKTKQFNVNPQLNNSNQIIWSDEGNIYTCNGQSLVSSIIGQGYDPKISDSGQAIWLKNNMAKTTFVKKVNDLIYYNLKTAKTTIYGEYIKDLKDILFSRTNNINISENGKVVWSSSVGEGIDQYDIYMRNSELSTTMKVATTTQWQPTPPLINNNGYIVYLGNSEELNLNDGTSTYIIPDSCTKYYQHVALNNNGWVVFNVMDENFKDQIHIYRNGNTTKITSNYGFSSEYPTINDNNEVVWLGSPGNLYQLFYYDGINISRFTYDSVDSFPVKLNNKNQLIYTCFDFNTTGKNQVRIINLPYNGSLIKESYIDTVTSNADWKTVSGEIKLPISFRDFWETKAPTPQLVESGGSLVSNTSDLKIYALTGINTTNFWQYDLKTNIWTVKASTPISISAGGSLAYNSLDGIIYALKGGNTKDFLQYNLKNDSWALKSLTPTAIGSGGALAFDADNKMMYALKGSNSKVFFQYYPKINKWVKRKAIPKPVGVGSALTCANGKVYALRGNNSTDFYEYNPVTNKWIGKTSIKNQPISSSSLTYNSANGAIYALVGNKTKNFLRYNVNDNTWSNINISDNNGSGGCLTFDSTTGKIYGIDENTTNFWTYNSIGDYQSPKIAQSITLDNTNMPINKAKLLATEKLNGQNIIYQLSRDGGETWENTINGSWHIFTSTSTQKSDLRWKAILSTNESKKTPIIEDVRVTY